MFGYGPPSCPEHQNSIFGGIGCPACRALAEQYHVQERRHQELIGSQQVPVEVFTEVVTETVYVCGVCNSYLDDCTCKDTVVDLQKRLDEQQKNVRGEADRLKLEVDSLRQDYAILEEQNKRLGDLYLKADQTLKAQRASDKEHAKIRDELPDQLLRMCEVAEICGRAFVSGDVDDLDAAHGSVCNFFDTFGYNPALRSVYLKLLRNLQIRFEDGHPCVPAND